VQKRSLPQLDIVSVRSLILHEDVEDHRVVRIMERLRDEKVLRNPPIVGQTDSGGGRLIVLDGASRVTAARRLRFPHMLVQIVPYPAPSITLEPWHHLVVGMSQEMLAEKAAAIAGVQLEPMAWKDAERALHEREVLACLRSPGKRTIGLTLSDHAQTGLKPLRRLTHLYVTDPGLHRVREDQVEFPEEWLGEEWVLVLFPHFLQEDIVRIALGMRDRLPMGVTRHSVPNRALRVYYPISWLHENIPIAAKRKRLAAFLEAKWEEGSIRHYPEGSTLYDE